MVVVVVVVDSHKVWGNKWCTQGSRKCSAGQVMAQPKGMVIGLSDQTGLGFFLQPWYSYSAVGGQQVPSTALHHTTLQFTHYSSYINLNI